MTKNKLPTPITLLILTLFTAFVWVGLNIYRQIAVKPVSPVPEKILKPITPTLNTDAIEKIEAAVFVPDSDIPEINISKSNTSGVKTQTIQEEVATESATQ